jgi:hypothetical protein
MHQELKIALQKGTCYKQFSETRSGLKCVVVLVLVIYHVDCPSWKRVKDVQSTRERMGMQLENTMLSRSNFNSEDESLNTNLHKIYLLVNQLFPTMKK